MDIDDENNEITEAYVELLMDSITAFRILSTAHLKVSSSFTFWDIWKELLIPGWVFERYEGKTRYNFAWSKIESAQRYVLESGLSLSGQVTKTQDCKS